MGQKKRRSHLDESRTVLRFALEGFRNMGQQRRPGAPGGLVERGDFMFFSGTVQIK